MFFGGFCVVFLEECPDSFSHRHNGRGAAPFDSIFSTVRFFFTNGKKKGDGKKKGHALHDQTVKLWLGCQLASNKSRWGRR
jgi:hypothetical protein